MVTPPQLAFLNRLQNLAAETSSSLTPTPNHNHSGAKEKVAPTIQSWTLHDLRRSFASGLQRLGIAPHIVELALNHRSGTFSGIAGIYQRHRYAKEVREAFELWSRHIEALTTNKAAAA
jgi:integrase